MAGRTPARSRSAWNRWDSDPAVTDDLEAIELAGGSLGDVGVERQTTFFDEMRQARVARVGLIDWCVGPRHLLAAGDEAAEG